MKKNYSHYFYSIFMCLLFSTHVFIFAQEYHFHQYTEYDGLLSNSINDIRQDPSGNIWVANRGGISMYDGASWKSYTVSDGLPFPPVAFIRFDSNGQAYAIPDTTRNIILTLSNGYWKKIIQHDTLNSYKTPVVDFEIIENNSEILFVLAVKDMGLLISSGDKWRIIGKDEGLPDLQIHDLEKDGNTLYIASDSGVSRFQNGSIDPSFYDSLSLKNTPVLAVSKKDAHSQSNIPELCILGRDFIGYIENSSLRILSDGITLPESDAIVKYHIMSDGFGGLFFGNELMLFHADIRGSVSPFSIENGLIAKGSSSLFKDREKLIWIGTARGLSKLVSMRFKNSTQKHGLFENEIASIVKLNDHCTVLGHVNGFTFMDSDRISYYEIPQSRKVSPHGIRVLDLARKSDTVFWAACARAGFLEYSLEKGPRWHSFEGNEFVNSVVADNTGGAYLAAGPDLYHYNNGKFNKVADPHLNEFYIRKLFISESGTLYMASINRGIMIKQKDSWKHIFSQEDEGRNNVYSLLNSEGKLFAGTIKGLCVMAGDTLLPYTISGMDISRPVYLLTEDSEKNIWIGTDNGVFKWNHKTLTHFTKVHGLMGKELNRSASSIDSDGNVWLGTDQGLSVYSGRYDSLDILPPLLSIEEITVNGIPVSISGEDIVLSHNDNNLTFKFHCSSFIDEHKNSTEVLLENYHTDWVSLSHFSQRTYHINNLSPGKYRFKIRTANAYRTQETQVQSPLIIIEVPFYSRWWFFLLTGIAGALLIFIILKIYTSTRYRTILEKTIEKRTQELLDAERKFTNIFNKISVGIYRSTPEGEITMANPAFIKMLGYETVNDLKAFNFNTCYPDSTIDNNDFINQLLEKGTVSGLEYPILTSSGKKIFVRENAVLVKHPDNTPKHIEGTLEDITERKKIETELITEKDRLEVTLQSIREGVICADTEGVIILMNDVAESLTGWDKTHAIGKPLHSVYTVKEKSEDQNHDSSVGIMHEIELGMPVLKEVELISKNRETIPVSESFAPIQHQGSDIMGWIIVFHDMREKKKIENELMKVQKLESLGVLAGGIAHDFNNILTGILGNVGMAKTHLGNDHPIFGKLTRAEQSIDRAQKLTHQLLTFAKGGSPVKENTQIDEIVSETIHFTLSGSNVLFTLKKDSDLYPVYCDAGQISQALNNLAVNAIQAMEQGGSLFVELKNIALSENNNLNLTEGSYVSISFTDTGTGIDPDLLSTIFDPYYTTKTNSSGLGLTSTYSIVKHHGGSIDVKSAIGQGSCFTVYLPASDHVSQRDESSTVVKKSETVKVLVMDDEETVRDVLKDIIELQGYESVEVEDGESAVKAYQDAMKTGNPFTIVIMDLTIPGGMGGLEAIKEVKKIDPDVKAVVSSGYSNNDVMSRYKDYGFSAVMKKPYRIDTVIDVLNRLLND